MGFLSYLFDSAHWQGPRGLGVLLVEQLLLSATAIAVAALVGLPIALWLGHLGRGGVLAINVSNIGRAVPTFAVLVVLSVGPLGTDELGPYGRAGLATLVSLVLFSIPPIVTNAYVGMREVDREVIEAAQGMGMRGWQLFGRVELPLAMPLVVTGLRLALVQVWATATIAALVAGPGLGNVITAGFSNQNESQIIAGALLVAVIALVLEGVVAGLERLADPVRRATRTRAVAAQPRVAS